MLCGKASKRCRKSVTNMPRNRIQNYNYFAFTDEEKAYAIANSLELQFSVNQITNLDTERGANEKVSSFLKIPPPPPLFSITTLMTYTKFKKIKNNKSPCICQITLKLYFKINPSNEQYL